MPKVWCLLQKGIYKMKKFLVLLLIFLDFAVITSASASIFPPEWTEFCPPRYCESNENVFSKDATYWYKRRLQFNNAIAKCSAYKDEQLDSCYEEIRAAEERKNKVWSVRQEEKYRTTEYNREYYMEKMKYDGVNQIIETIKK